MCSCSSFRENCVTHARTHARTHAHGANYDLPPVSRAGDKIRISNRIWHCDFYLQTTNGSQLLFSLGAILPHTLIGYLFSVIAFKIRHG